MAGYKERFVLFRRKKKKGYVWYYRLPGDNTGHSTGKTLKRDAIEFVETEIERRKENPITLGEFIEPYFVWGKFPHIRRLRVEGKSISPRYAKDQRRRLEMYLFGDPICAIPLRVLRRADILDYRDRLFDPDREKQIGARTANCTMGALIKALPEAYFREEIDRDPTVGIGEIKYQEQEEGVFTLKEMKALFREMPGVWTDLSGYVAFILAAQVGLRRGEILALIWGQIDSEQSFVNVNRAMTDNGLPKWDKIRGTPIPAQCRNALLTLRRQTEYLSPHQSVICGKDGKPRSEYWWRERFKKAMNAAGLDRIGRNLRPHSLRHTLNTELRGAGANPSKLREILGWSSEQVQKKCTHWQPEHFEDQRRLMDQLFEGD